MIGQLLRFAVRLVFQMAREICLVIPVVQDSVKQVWGTVSEMLLS